MISINQHGPARRTFEEDDEEEQALQFIHPVGQLNLTIDGEVSEVCTVLHAFGLSVSPFAQSIISSLDMQQVGNVQMASGGQKLSTIYYSHAHKTMLAVSVSIPSQLSFTFAELFGRFEPKTCIILGELNLSAYHGSGTEGELRKVCSSSYLSSSNNSMDNVPLLETGIIVPGISAGLLNYAEARNISAVLFLTLSRASLTTSSMRAFEKLATLLQSLTEGSITLPTSAVYNNMLKRDPYLLKTENMYS